MSTRCRAQAGFTLIEALIVIVMIGVLALIAGPRIQDAQRQQNMRNGVNAVSALYSQARAAAVTRGAEARLLLTADSAWVTIHPASGAQVVGSVEPLTARFGVTLGGVDSIRIASTGIPIGIATREAITITKGAKVESLYVSRYGRME